MKPLREISPGRRNALGLAFFILFFAVWAAATLGGFVPKTFLADPIAMVKSGWVLLSVPNALVRGCFAALDEPGVELPL